jgi:O-antigen ligase
MVVEPAIFFLLLRVVRLSERDIVRLIDVLLFAGLAVAGIGLLFYVQGIEGAGVVLAEQGSRRLASVYGSPNNAALFLGRCVPYAFAMLLIAPGGLRRAVAGLALVVLLLATVLTQSGGALLFGIPAGIISVLILWNRRRGLIVAGAVGLLLIALIPFVIPRLQGALALTRASSFVRTQVWASTISLLRERPLTGAGIDQFLYLYRSRYILPEAWREPDLSHPHNIILDYWVTLGIMGLAVLAALQLGFWRSALAAWRRWRERDPLLAAVAVGAIGSMAAFLAHGLIDNSYFVVDLAYVFCLTLAIAVRLAGSGRDTTK